MYSVDVNFVNVYFRFLNSVFLRISSYFVLLAQKLYKITHTAKSITGNNYIIRDITTNNFK